MSTELKWRHTGKTKSGWVSRTEYQNGKFFRTKLRDFFIEFSDIPNHEAVDWSQEQIGDWLDAKEVLYQNPGENKLIIYSVKLKVAFGITFTDSRKKDKKHYRLAYLNLEEPEEEEENEL